MNCQKIISWFIVLNCYLNLVIYYMYYDPLKTMDMINYPISSLVGIGIGGSFCSIAALIISKMCPPFTEYLVIFLLCFSNSMLFYWK